MNYKAILLIALMLFSSTYAFRARTQTRLQTATMQTSSGWGTSTECVENGSNLFLGGPNTVQQLCETLEGQTEDSIIVNVCLYGVQLAYSGFMACCEHCSTVQ